MRTFLGHLVCLSAALVFTPSLAQAATCHGGTSITQFSGTVFDVTQVEGYFRLASIPGVLDVHSYRRAHGAGGGQTANYTVYAKAGGDRVEVVWTATGSEIRINGALVAADSSQTPGGATVVRALASVAITFANGTKVSATRVPLANSYLNFSIEIPAAMVARVSGSCVGIQFPVPPNEALQLPSDVRVAAEALDRAPAGEAIRYRVDVHNAGAYALNSIAFSAPPSWGPAASWICTASNGAACAAASGVGNPSGPLALPASGQLRYEITALAPSPLAAGTMLARATAPAWTTAAASTVNDASLAWAARYVDADGDGFGAEPQVLTAPGANLVDVGGDCDDTDPSIVPGTAACCVTAVECDDGDACTEDACNATACTHTPACSVDAGSDSGVDASTPDPVSDAGSPDAGPSRPGTPMPDAGGTPPDLEAPAADAEDDGCSCRAAGTPMSSSPWLALGLACAMAARARRRR